MRIPVAQAEKLDRAAFELRTSKQDLVSGLLARYVDPGSPRGLAALRELSPGGFGFGDRRRITVETEGDVLTVGRHSFRPAEPDGVLTVGEVAELLQVEPEAVEDLAREGELPGREIGGEWRFVRRAVLEWLAGKES